MRIIKFETEPEWKAYRTKGIGGSEASCIIGMNKYRSNLDLFRVKTGEFIPDDISDKPSVKYGKEAEQYIREMFKLDFPEYKVEYHPYWMYLNKDFPFMFATLDGEIATNNGERGILEIKTTTIQNALQWREWEDRKVPDAYYVQMLHQLACTEWEFVILRAYIRYYDSHGSLKARVKDETLYRKDVEEEIKYLCEKEKEFWDCVTYKKKPNLILPKI